MVQNPDIKLVIDDIEKSQQDNRKYRALELTNGMRVLLVSDAETDKSAASMDVHVGHLKDPWEIQGLAHFCEHMLFLGTKKYPEENEYNKFLSEHGGSSNAFTSVEHTNYHFDVAPDHLPAALDRFAQFFLGPLFTSSATERELKAVNSENDKNLQSDQWRILQLLRSTSAPDHDYSKFGTGNKYTLETHPKELNIDVREALLKFHSEYYSSNIMGLTVLGKESLDELSDLIVPLFTGVENKNIAVPEWTTPPHGPDQLQKTASIVPVMDIRSLNVIWPIPDIHPHYRSNPGHYLGHLIGHEGEGSLLSELKLRGWCNNLVGGQRSGANGFMFFGINMDLTEEGLGHVDDIITLMYQYIHLLTNVGPKEWVFNECKDLNAMTFRFKDKERPSGYVTSMSGMLYDYPLDEILTGPYLQYEFRPDLIDMVLSKLTPDTMRVGIVAKAFEGSTDRKEKWYGTDYKLETISAEKLQAWQTCGLHDNLQLPRENEFIPTNFELVPRETEPSPLPELIRDNSHSRIWYKQDDKFLLPKSCICFEITSPYAYMDPIQTNMAILFTQLLKDALTEYTYNAELSGLHYSLDNTMNGLYFSVKGYNDKQQIFLQRIMEKLATFEVDQTRYDILKEAYVRNLRNFSAEPPHRHAMYYTSMLMSEIVWTKDEMLEATDDVTFDRLKAFIPQLLSKLYFEGLMHGNITKQTSLEIIDTMEKIMREKCGTKPLSSSQHKRYRELKLPHGCYYLYQNTNAVHSSSCIEIYYQCGMQTTQSNMLLELFCQVISEPCFNELRTKEQLGYIVFSGIRRASGVQGLRVIVQSDRKPDYVETRIEAFLQNMQSYLSEMSEEDFQKNVTALATLRSEKPKQLASQTSRYWSEISSQHYNFDRDEIEVKHLKTVTKDELLSFYQEFIANNSSKRHKLSVHILSTAEAPTPAETTDSADLPDGLLPVPPLSEPVVICDMMSFKRDLGLYPLARPFINLDQTKSKL